MLDLIFLRRGFILKPPPGHVAFSGIGRGCSRQTGRAKVSARESRDLQPVQSAICLV